jgi:predicted esterase
MIRPIRLLLIMLLIIACQSINGQVQLKNFNYKGKAQPYLIQLPNHYNPTKTYPVLIGPSEIQDKADESFYWRGNSDTDGWILVSYPIYNATNRKGEIKAFLAYLNQNYQVEEDKFHAVCFSANSSSIFDLVMELPTHFKGITGMAGNPNNRNTKKMQRLKEVNVQFIVGDQDPYWMRSAQKSQALLTKIGVNSKIEIIPKGKHVMEGLIGKGFLERAHRLRK